MMALATRKLICTIKTPHPLAGIAISGDGKTVVVVSDQEPVLFLIDTASERVRERERQQQEAVVSVRQQIAELQALMEREVEKATADKAASQAGGRAAQEACARETARLDAEINRLQEIPDTFGTSGGHAQA